MSTQGPWRILSDGTIWSDAPGKHGIAPSGQEVAQVTMRRTALGEYFDRSDAELIAAAPELRAMVERLADKLAEETAGNRENWGHQTGEENPEVIAARALLERTKP